MCACVSSGLAFHHSHGREGGGGVEIVLMVSWGRNQRYVPA